MTGRSRGRGSRPQCGGMDTAWPTGLGCGGASERKITWTPRLTQLEQQQTLSSARQRLRESSS